MLTVTKTCTIIQLTGWLLDWRNIMYENLRKIREELGYTQEEVSGLLGYKTKNAYSLKERGERKITLVEAQKIAKLFKKSIEEIFFEDEVIKVLTNDIKVS
jgi:putative transcriptional regulator